LGAAASLSDSGHLSAAGSFIAGAGIAGGLTTFSTLAVDAVVLWRASRFRATMYVATTGVAGVLAGIAGWWLAQSFS
jgi:CrcB protein